MVNTSNKIDEIDYMAAMYMHLKAFVKNIRQKRKLLNNLHISHMVFVQQPFTQNKDQERV